MDEVAGGTPQPLGRPGSFCQKGILGQCSVCTMHSRHSSLGDRAVLAQRLVVEKVPRRLIVPESAIPGKGILQDSPV